MRPSDTAIFAGGTAAFLAVFLALNVFLGVPFMDDRSPNQQAETTSIGAR